MCTVITRDVGVTYSLPKSISVFTQANISLPVDEEKTVSVPEAQVKEVSIETELTMAHVYSETELDQNIAKAIKMYEQTFHHLLHPKKKEKPVLKCTGIQTDSIDSTPLKIVEKRDASLQAVPCIRSKDVGVIAKCRVADVSVSAVVRMRHFGSSDHRVDQTICEKCNSKRCSIGVGPNAIDKYGGDHIPLSLNSLNVTRSKSFDYTEKPIGFMRRKYGPGTRSVACSTPLAITSNKSTDTSEYFSVGSKDVGVNTMKRKLVDAEVGDVTPSNQHMNICDKCGVTIKNVAKNILQQSSNKVEQLNAPTSRIPRPTTLVTTPSPTSGAPSDKKFHRQNTYTKIEAKEIDTSLRPEEAILKERYVVLVLNTIIFKS